MIEWCLGFSPKCRHMFGFRDEVLSSSVLWCLGRGFRLQCRVR